MAKKLGVANCPKCGVTDIKDIQKVTVSMGRGICNPFAVIDCDKCHEAFAATITWESAYIFDKMGCKVIGFSPSKALPFTKKEIDAFIIAFDRELEIFLDIVDSESS